MVDWTRSKEAKPPAHVTVLLHTPQWSLTSGDFTTGCWDGTDWFADDGRDFTGNPPVHWATVSTPEFEGDADEWADEESPDEEPV